MQETQTRSRIDPTHCCRRMAVLLAVLVLFARFANCDQLRIIELQHRPAKEIIPIVEPLLAAEETVSGDKFVIFLTAAPQNIARIESIIRTLDMPPRHLLITVVQGENAEEALDSVDLSGDISIGDHTKISLGRSPPNPDSVSIEGRSRSSARSDLDIQHLRVQDGVPATIYLTYSTPVSMPPVASRSGGRQHPPQVVFREASTGFRVTVRVATDRFVLDIASQRESNAAFGTGAVESQHIQTQVQGRLNQWIGIGEILDGRQQREAGLLYRDESRKQVGQRVFLRIVEVDPGNPSPRLPRPIE